MGYWLKASALLQPNSEHLALHGLLLPFTHAKCFIVLPSNCKYSPVTLSPHRHVSSVAQSPILLVKISPFPPKVRSASALNMQVLPHPDRSSSNQPTPLFIHIARR
ncbi:hypothetical protein BT63DRAFT_423187 [Microthyrium microscopicum]|uniref:Uncharacterized protein n=1 Tax=Microthyrium microscopicum TaxID=703497 RepID=A0A6A6UHJ6_9PEZI|nr:hypothetical protein BT63DRAFT_423187 [Microthyrium microscopicum]